MNAPTLEHDFPMARLTTVRTGGRADVFARADSEERLIELLAYARENDHRVGVVGSGSNLLVSDDGFRGLVLKLGGALATIEREGERVLCGGGMRLPSAAASAARWGLSGLEFGVNIPGTVGGAVRMNANAYGGELARTLEWVSVCSDSGVERRTPDQLGFSYRRSNIAEGEIVSRAAFGLESGRPGHRESNARGDARQAPRGSAVRNQDVRLHLQEPRRPASRRAARRGKLLEAAGCRGLSVGGAKFSDKHANFVENSRRGDHRGHHRADGDRKAPGPRILRSRARARGTGAR